MKISFNEFWDKYNPCHNTIYALAGLEGILFELSDEERDYVDSLNESKVWSFMHDRTLLNGNHFGSSVLGYVVCEKSYDREKGKIKVEI